MMLFIVVIALAVSISTAFVARPVQYRFNGFISMSSAEDPLDAIRAKVAADPSYNPMQDPQAMQALQDSLPQELKDVPTAIQRLKVAFEDATGGVDKIGDLDSALNDINLKDLISSPTSKWLREGMPKDDPPFSKSRLNELKEELSQKYPQVPFEN